MAKYSVSNYSNYIFSGVLVLFRKQIGNVADVERGHVAAGATHGTEDHSQPAKLCSAE